MSRIGRKYAADSYPEPPRGGGGSGNGNEVAIIYDPSQPSSGARVQTWTEVMAAIAASGTPVTLYVVSSRVIGAGAPVPVGTWDMKNARISSLFAPPNWSGHLELADGAVLHDVAALADGGYIVANSNTQASMTFTGNPFDHNSQYLSLSNNSVINNRGTHAVWDVPGPSPSGGRVDINSNSAVFGTLASIAPNGDLAVVISDNGVGFVDNALFVGDGTTQATQVTDGTAPFPGNPGMLGSTTNIVENGIGGAQRPVAINPGTMWFDNALIPPRPIWWDGARWVDSAGAPV